jgi:hypothetical protein
MPFACCQCQVTHHLLALVKLLSMIIRRKGWCTMVQLLPDKSTVGTYWRKFSPILQLGREQGFYDEGCIYISNDLVQCYMQHARINGKNNKIVQHTVSAAGKQRMHGSGMHALPGWNMQRMRCMNDALSSTRLLRH